jgi:hypothetical protein
MNTTINPSKYIRQERFVWHGSDEYLNMIERTEITGRKIARFADSASQWVNLGTETSDMPGSEGDKFDRLVRWEASARGEVLNG